MALCQHTENTHSTKFGPGSVSVRKGLRSGKNRWLSSVYFNKIKQLGRLIIGRPSVQIPKAFPSVTGQALTLGLYALWVFMPGLWVFMPALWYTIFLINLIVIDTGIADSVGGAVG
jgi:hypothetical protein